MSLSSNRGAILEEVILCLLERLGFRIVDAGEEGTKLGTAGLEVPGRGELHQIDAFAAFDFTPPFVYPLRLLFEAKCYSGDRPVGIEVVRNAVGVLKDISENYFSSPPQREDAYAVKMPRFNFVSAIFSTSGYTDNAQRYAVAHQIFLVQYRNNFLFEPISQALLSLTENDFKKPYRKGETATMKVRQFLRSKLKGENPNEVPFSQQGLLKFQNITGSLAKIHGSYFGMLQGRWPIHLLSARTLPTRVFAGRDNIACRVYGRVGNTWSFVPLNGNEASPDWFRLEFDLPDEIARLVQDARGDRQEIARLKMEHFSFIALSGMIGGVRRQIRLELDEAWITQYLERRT